MMLQQAETSARVSTMHVIAYTANLPMQTGSDVKDSFGNIGWPALLQRAAIIMPASNNSENAELAWEFETA